jgi:hypothetical protein
MNTFIQGYGPGPAFIQALGVWLLVIILWTLFWKGLALWHSARRGQYWWFVVMLVVNTMGLLEIVYLFAVAKKKFSDLFSL